MASWHQEQAMKRNGVVLHHPYKFTVVNDGNCLCVVRFTHESEAEI